MMGLAVLLAGCGGGSGTDSTSSSASTSEGSTGAAAGGSSSSTDAVTIKNYLYGPESITVPVGTTVKFTNEDSTPHTATSKLSGVFESGPIDTGKSATIKLEKAGTFAYYCVFHPFMHGTITVE